MSQCSYPTPHVCITYVSIALHLPMHQSAHLIYAIYIYDVSTALYKLMHQSAHLI